MIDTIVVAAGAGTRLGFDLPKALARLADSTVVGVAVRHLDPARTVVVVPPDYRQRFAEALPGWALVPGGRERSDSVRAGLAHVTGEHVLIHDAARALTPAVVFDRVRARLDAGVQAVIPVLPVVDTIKVVRDGIVVATPDRRTLRAVQTPQGFSVDVIARAHSDAGVATDDATLVEALGVAVHVVAGDPLAFKITDRRDLREAEQLLEES